MKHFALFVTYCFAFCFCGRQVLGIFLDKHADDPDIYKNVSELITTKGYPLEEHTVLTKDGYILSVQRIPHGRDESNPGKNKQVILLLHGEAGDSKTWFLNPPGQGLGYVLPDAGYDVWAMNTRGSDYSKKHKVYAIRDTRFWNFSFDEMGQHDLPATIDYILDYTGQKKLFLIGYSRGNTVAFATLSELPAYNEKVILFVALAPIAFIGHCKFFVRNLVPFAEEIYYGFAATTQGEFFPHNNFTKRIAAEFCEVDDLEICENFMFAIGGVDRKHVNESRIPLYGAQYPSSTSAKILLHFAQIIRNNEFQKFDYGAVGNKIIYNHLAPPDYQLSAITAPVALFSSDNDIIAVPRDVAKLRSRLKSLVPIPSYHPPKEYSHLDFILAKDCREIVYDPLLDLLADY